MGWQRWSDIKLARLRADGVECARLRAEEDARLIAAGKLPAWVDTTPDDDEFHEPPEAAGVGPRAERT